MTTGLAGMPCASSETFHGSFPPPRSGGGGPREARWRGRCLDTAAAIERSRRRRQHRMCCGLAAIRTSARSPSPATRGRKVTRRGAWNFSNCLLFSLHLRAITEPALRSLAITNREKIFTPSRILFGMKTSYARAQRADPFLDPRSAACPLIRPLRASTLAVELEDENAHSHRQWPNS
jgi:hypothetical protein